MQMPEKRIEEFIKQHHVFTLATCANNIPWCSACFYVYDSNNVSLIFTSDNDTRHALEAIENNSVAGNIVLETSVVGKIRGVQLSGKVHMTSGLQKKECKLKYLKRFPYAILSTTAMWEFEIESIKMTDNRLGFGKKLKWNKNDGNQT